VEANDKGINTGEKKETSSQVGNQTERKKKSGEGAVFPIDQEK